MRKPELIYYTDGACSGNPGPGGYGIVRLGKRYENNQIFLTLEYYYNEYNEKTTNNREEMKAVIHVLREAASSLNYNFKIYSDSAYVVNMCNQWIWSWAKNGWHRSKNQPIENLDLVQEIYNLLNRDFINVEICKCAGHSGVLENELADALAANNKNKFDKLIKENNIDIPSIL